jgi:hypothetical protein
LSSTVRIDLLISFTSFCTLPGLSLFAGSNLLLTNELPAPINLATAVLLAPQFVRHKYQCFLTQGSQIAARHPGSGTCFLFSATPTNRKSQAWHPIPAGLMKAIQRLSGDQHPTATPARLADFSNIISRKDKPLRERTNLLYLFADVAVPLR